MLLLLYPLSLGVTSIQHVPDGTRIPNALTVFWTWTSNLVHGCRLLCVKGLWFTVYQRGCDLLCIKGLWFIVYNWVVIYCVLKGCELLCIKGFEENDTQSSFSLGSLLNCNSKHAWKWSNWMRWLCVCGQDMIHKMDISHVTAVVCVWRWIASEWDACVCVNRTWHMKWTCNCAWRWIVNEWAVVCVDRTWPMKWTCLTGCWAVSSEAVCDTFTFFPLLCGFLFHAATACFFWVSSVCL